jgi:hypothetical protein
VSQQGALTVRVPIRAERLEQLRALLDPIGDDVNGQRLIPFGSLSTVHFMRWVIVEDPDAPDGKLRFDPQLVMETNFDGPLEGHVRELVDVARSAFDAIYTLCGGYPGPSATTSEVMRFLLAHRIPYAAFYVGARGRSARRIRDEALLWEAVQSFLDRRGKRGLTAPARVDEIREFVGGRADLRWALELDPPEDLSTRLSYYEPLILTGAAFSLLVAVATGFFHLAGPWSWEPAFALGAAAVVGAALLLALIVAATLLIVLASLEAGDKDLAESAEDVTLLVNREDQVVQNQLSHLVDMKGGWLRAVIARLVFTTIDLLARFFYNKGELGGIPSIHFARWVFLDGGKRLLFFSNFDGSWESYLGDFIDRAALGLTAVWSNTLRFPRTNWRIEPSDSDNLFFSGGACDEERFKRWTRNRQIRTQVWYSAYPTLSIQNVNNNSRVRDGIAGDLHGESPEEWLRRLG